MVVLELRSTAVWTATELDLEGLIDLLRLWPANARMSALAPWPLGRHGAFLGVATERSSLAVRGALGLLELRFQLRDAFCFSFQLFVQPSVLGSQDLQFGRHLSQALGLQEGGLE
jgi:hypothetical protein